ncbi:MAG: ABC transporter permease [Polyangiaceae bacterium]|nr:ABC transporter permease [Polyangiaceae bacterium]
MGSGGRLRPWARLVGVVCQKELRDSLRDRRSLLSALLFPLVGPLLVAGVLTFVARRETSERPVEVPVVGRSEAPELVRSLEDNGVVLRDPPDDVERAVRDGDAEVVLVIPEGHGAALRAATPAKVELVSDSSRSTGSRAERRLRELLQTYGGTLGALRLVARGVHPELAQAVAVVEVDLATPQQLGARLFGMIPMFVLLGAFVGGMYVATDSTAGERERGSLEPLLCNPVSRGALVVGKWLATVAFAAATAMLTLATCSFVLGRVPLDALGMSFGLTPSQILGLCAAVLPLVLFAPALQLCVATFARTFKEAQTYLSFAMFLPMLPGIFLGLAPFKSAPWMSAVPILGQQVMLTDLMNGRPVPALSHVLGTVSALVLTALSLRFAASLLRRERIVFGR